MRRFPLLLLLSWLGIACHTGDHTGGWDGEVIVGMSVSTNFVDHGLKAVVLENLDAFACRSGACRKFHLTAPEKGRLLKSYDDNAFVELNDMHAEGVLDGGDVRLMVSDHTHGHEVENYATSNRQFAAIQLEFEGVIDAHPEGTPVTVAELRGILMQRTALWNGDPRAQIVDRWLASNHFLHPVNTVPRAP
jgi:hypothetical protein